METWLVCSVWYDEDTVLFLLTAVESRECSWFSYWWTGMNSRSRAKTEIKIYEWNYDEEYMWCIQERRCLCLVCWGKPEPSICSSKNCLLWRRHESRVVTQKPLTHKRKRVTKHEAVYDNCCCFLCTMRSSACTHVGTMQLWFVLVQTMSLILRTSIWNNNCCCCMDFNYPKILYSRYFWSYLLLSKW